MPKLSNIAQEAVDQFETKTRDDGSRYVNLADNDGWIYDMVRKAHGDRLPDDRTFELVESACETIADADLDDEHDLERADLDVEWADGQVDVYNSDRTEWLNASLYHAGYCDEAQQEGLVSDDADIFDRIGAGQYVQARDVWGVVSQAIISEWESREDDPDDEEGA